MKRPAIILILLLITSHFSTLLAQTDSLATSDTISVRKQRVLFNIIRTYRYQLAGNLTSQQLLPLLKRSPDEETATYIRLYKRQHAVALSLMSAGYVGMTSGLLISFKHPVASFPLMVGGLGLFFSAPVFRAERTVEQAVLNHNLVLRSRSGDYYRSMFDLRPQSDGLTIADTVRIKGYFFRPEFLYRGLRVDPATNLRTAFEYLNSGRLNANIRYVRTVRSVSGFLNSLASTTLFSSLLIYAVRNSNGSYPLNRGLIYPALGTIGVTVLANWHANQVQMGTMREYNLKIRERSSGSGE